MGKFGERENKLKLLEKSEDMVNIERKTERKNE